MCCGIYNIFCKETNKSYIGQSKNIENRWYQHKNELKNNRHVNYKLQEDYNLYGLDKFEFLILKEEDEEFLNALESHFIQVYDSISNGYNIRNELGTVTNKFKVDYSESKNIKMLETTPIKINLREIVFSQLINTLDFVIHYYGTRGSVDKEEELIRESNDYYSIISNILSNDLTIYSYDIFCDYIEKHISDILEPFVEVESVDILVDENKQEDYILEELNTLNLILKYKKLPIYLKYKVNNTEKDIYLEIPIEDSEPILDKNSFHNCSVKFQIEQLKRKLVI